MADLAAAVAALDEAVEVASGFVAAEDLAPVTDLAEAVRKRHGFLGETVVVALAGGTGSGKSSLLNALAGADVSPVGAVRPTTGEPLAWIPANPEPGLVRLLEDIGVDRRIGHELEVPLAVIDLPDYDSVEFDHRRVVEALVPRVDAVVWVLDPQKYSDRALHRDYLIPLARYQGQFLFVLNQVDRLDQAGKAAVLEDLGSRLESEGFVNPEIVTTSARPATGPLEGVVSFRESLAARFETKRAVHNKLLLDLQRAGDLLREEAGLTGTKLEADASWDTAQRVAVGRLADLVAGPSLITRSEEVGERLASSRAAGPLGRAAALLRRSRLGRALGAAPDETGTADWWTQPGLEKVLAGVSRSVTDISTGVGGELGRRLRSEFAPDRLEQGIRASVEGARHSVGEPTLPRSRWWWAVAGVLQIVLFAGLVAGLVWLWVDGIDRGQIPWNLILVAGSAGLGAVIAGVARASGRRAGRRTGEDYRTRISQDLEEQMRDRIGDPVHDTLAVRDRLAGALATLDEYLV